MRYVVYGAGAVGGAIGGRLSQHGHDVVLIARGEHGAAIRQRGLTLADPDATVTVEVPCVERPGDVRWDADDLVVLAMKTQDTDAALRELEASAPAGLPIACAQNGLENERLALRRSPDVYAMCVILPATHLRPGEVVASSAPTTGLLDLGRHPEGVDDRAERFAVDLRASTFRSRVLPDVLRNKRRKLLMNLLNALEATVGITEATAGLAARVQAEGEACFLAAGLDVQDAAEEREVRGDHLRVRPVGGERRGGGSSWQSLARGAGSIEADHLNGEIVLLGRLHGVPTPANELLRRTANRMAREGAAPGSLAVSELLAALG